MADQIQLERLTAAIDHLAGMMAATVAYVAHLPGAPMADIKSIKTMAETLSPQATAVRGTAPVQHALHTVDRIFSMAQSLQTVRSAGQSARGSSQSYGSFSRE